MKWKEINEKLKTVIKDKKSPFGKYNFNEALLVLVRERFIARASQSKVKDSVILKGGLLLTTVYTPQTRMTADADLTVRKAAGLKGLRKIVDEILTIELDDGFKFKRDSGKLLSNDDREYDGAHFSIECDFGGGSKSTFGLDLAIGDSVDPVKGRLPTLTEFQVTSFELNIYPPEAIAAEKLQTCIHRGGANTRMKDYFDLYVLIGIVNKSKFETAAKRTFKRRGTQYPGTLPEPPTDRMRAAWSEFLNSNRYRVLSRAPKELKTVMKEIREFYGTLEP